MNVRSRLRFGSPACLGGVLAAAALCAACSSATPGESADSGSSAPAPLSCDAGVPSYKSVIVPILQQDCLPCHSPGGIGGFDESTYADVSAQAGNMLTMVVQGAMPPANGPQMTSAQRVALTDWLECGAPNN
jgi:uncharacterized membrane protein